MFRILEKLQYIQFLSLICFVTTGFSQILSWSPLFLTEDDSVVIVYDATQGNGGLQGYTGDVYAHTGVITTESTSPSDWKHVKTQWGENTTETRLEYIGTDLYQFVITPSIRNYYQINPGETVLELAFVFRSASSPYLEGKTETWGDIFLPLRSGLTILSPLNRPLFMGLNDTLTIHVVSSPETDTLKLFEDNILVAQANNDTLLTDLIAGEYGTKWLKIIAKDSTAITGIDSFYYTVNSQVIVEALPAGIQDGINIIDPATVTLSLLVPDKKFVYVIGDFNNWEIDQDFYMKLTPDSLRWWLTLNNLSSQDEIRFQYFVDGEIKIADPYAEKLLDPWNDSYILSQTYPDLISYPAGETEEIVSVFSTDTASYPWQVTDFRRPDHEDLIIYELLIRDFIANHDYQTLIDTLGYFEKLGINAIELMPVNEFEGNESWGYNPSFYFAPDKYYGPARDLKQFIDECHQLGIAVILDMVLNHSTGQSPLVRLYNEGNYGKPTPDNPWFNVNATHPYSVFNDMNHESPYTKAFIDRVNTFWLTEYKVDGFRFDLSKGFTQKNSGSNVGLWSAYDASRIAILKRMADVIWSVDSTAYVILEHFADNAEEKELAEYKKGMMLWGNLNSAYSQSAMGWLDDPGRSSDLSWGYFATRGWAKPGLVTYMESHDESWLMYKNLQYGRSNGSYDIKNLSTALDRIKLMAAFFLTLPGPKMMWQFGELGYDQYLPDSGPSRTANKPILWNYYNHLERKNLYETIAALIKLRKENDVFRSEKTYVQMRVGQGQYDRRINLIHDSLQVTIIGNFHVTSLNVNPNFQKKGDWYEYFSGDTLTVTNTQSFISLPPGEFRIYTDKKLEKPDIPTFVNDPINGSLSFHLFQNYPNPFNPSTTIRYELNEQLDITIDIINIRGQTIRTFNITSQSPGNHQIIWDGRNHSGRYVSSGVYVYRIKAGDFIQKKKMLLIR